VRLAQLDTVLLASDGLFDNLYIEEIVDCIRSGGLEQAMDRLLIACRRRMKKPGNGQPSKPDDLTFILVRRKPRRRAGGKAWK
jgi:serine/threonine protein phosphatase PrpC